MKEVAEFYQDARRQWGEAIHDQWPAIARAYRGRAYHNLEHLGEMITHLTALPVLPAPASSPTFAMALIYHDYVYRPTRGDNEAKSADVCVEHLSGTDASLTQLERCRQLIMATKTHRPSASDDGGEALLIDLDLAVLARPAEKYRQYVKAIRKEFWMYPGVLYRPGRIKVLRHFLDQEHIYKTAYGREHYEARARKNLTAELRQLGGQP
ncbi:hypothetical protein [Lewinella sp. W8]|uniref:HD domain-containing protein n=1 Tax=Lewinella sp. W8 TaxID=2528208 RepID=UPI0010673508|nr:hypothetical protein [Lewinella sp. W8]MTB53642.1 hypothetical protein [Lewinella sp. W8]